MTSPTQGFSKAHRITRSSEINHCKNNGKKRVSGTYVVLRTPCVHAVPRVALIVTKKTGNAVVRNSWKRMIREAFRKEKSKLSPSDFVVIVRAHTKGKPDLSRASELLRILKSV